MAEQDPNELKREAARKRKAAQRARQKEAVLAAQREEYRSGSADDISRKDGESVLEVERGLHNRSIIVTCFDRARKAARHHGLKFDAAFLRNGLRSTLAGVKLATIPDTVVEGETFFRRDLYALYDFSMYKHTEMSFDDYLAERRKLKSNPYELGRALGKDFHPVPHGEWSDFFPKFSPDGLRPNYTQEQLKAWLDRQTSTKDFMLLASRSMYKSTFAGVLAVSYILCSGGGLRILLISETKILSARFVRGIRSYFVVKGEHTYVQELFAEHCVGDDDSKLSYKSPVAHLNLIQETVEATSMDSQTAGTRYDIGIFDDMISDKSTNTDALTEGAWETYLVLQKLREIPGGLSIVVGTPWRHDDSYAQLMKQADEEREEGEPFPLRYKIDPAWRPKPEFAHIPVADLKEHQVVLTFPERLTFKVLVKERRASLPFFMSQNLVMFPSAEGEGLRITFTEDVMRKHMVGRDYFSTCPVHDRVASLDWATSTARYADGSALVFADILKKDETDASGSHTTKFVAFINDVIYGKWKISELADEIVKQLIAHPGTTRMVIEKSGPWESLGDAMKRAAYIRGFTLPYIIWQATNTSGGTNLNAKAKRIKGLEPLLAGDQLYLKNMDTEKTNHLMTQFTNFDGSVVKKSNSTRKEDIPDAIALLTGKFLPRPVNQVRDPEEEKASRQQAEDETREYMRKAQHAAIFGTGPASPIQTALPTVMAKAGGKFQAYQRGLAERAAKNRYHR